MRGYRALIVLVIALIHALLLSLLWRALHQPLPNRLNIKSPRPDRSQTIVFLVKPDAPAVTKARRDSPPISARPKRANREHDIAVPAPVYGSEISNAAAMPSAPAAAPADAASAPVRTAQPLRLDAETMKRAIADAEHGTFRDMAKNAGRLDEIEPKQPDKFARAIAGAAVPTLREMVAAMLAAAREDACRPAHGVFGRGSIGGNTDWPFIVPNPGDCKK